MVGACPSGGQGEDRVRDRPGGGRDTGSANLLEHGKLVPRPALGVVLGGDNPDEVKNNFFAYASLGSMRES